jgi:hypothetical protein
MKFNFCLGNLFRTKDDWGANFAVTLTVGDLIQMLRLALEQAGHTVMVSRTYIARDAINIFMAGFHTEHRDVARVLKERGYRFGIVASEWLKDGLYNPFEQTIENSQRLYNEFCEGASFAEFIWYLVEESADCCLASNKNSHLLKIGYIPGYANLLPPQARQYEWDFSFAGYTSDHRKAVLDAIMSRGFSVAASVLDVDYLRASVLECSLITLSISKTPQHPFISLTRIPHAIMNRIPVIAEYGGRSHYLSPYCTTAASQTFVDDCAAFAARTDLVRYAQDAHDRYARDFPMTDIVKNIVTDTFD